MDARPFRPRGSENMQPLLQRHKSIATGGGALAAPAAGLKGPAKRAAFGDVTNVSKVLGARGDEARGAKKAAIVSTSLAPVSVSILNKENAMKPGKVDLSRPAQRPTGLASNKPKASTIEARAEPLQKKPANHNSTSRAAPGAHSLQPRHHKSQPQLKQQQPALRRTQSKMEKADLASNKPALVAADIEPLVMPPLIEDFLTGDESYLDSLESLTFPSEEPSGAEDVNHGDNHVEVLPKLLNVSEEPAVAIEVEPYKENVTLALSEVEEYWEEEDEEYDDQDQGYTTAHSTRSRDMTLANATAVIAPRVSSRVQRELDEARIEVEQTITPEEIDEEMWDVSMVAEYGEEIFEYMRELEIKMLPNPYYMEMQSEIQWSMRTVLMDWLVQVHHRFNLLPETLFLTVNYIDRFLSCKIVSIGKLQLVGATAILVASKYEEINCPSLDEIVYMVDGGYTTEDILKAERFMLSMLGFELGWPGPMSFLRRVSKADDYDLDTRTLAKYFLELTIMDERFVASPPSFLAAGAHCLSRLILNKGEWTKRHVHYSGYTWSQLRSLVTMMIECCENPHKHHAAVFEKYREKRFKEVSTQVQRALDAGFTLPHHTTPVRRSQPRLPSTTELQYGSLLIPIES
ncbi:hypothetical protein BBK36DRAFT_1183693 [Trichoderma citrinoviride]|uniref:Uncharacterized protein n=1 Tax=Trichoderma citrinoviride TaxID=58853 RepID=A0A2T4B0U8_9HYPO|nr:hypothetical protein BBK36DRAFT_1183693 [Trichoderma citrinoviride]PTB62851.1 hypothetical protein BBK36DRAFT_1183693 [Trichoderma citrinoviride]